MKRIWWAAWLAVCAACASLTANAHAFLDHASPVVGSTIHEAPSRIALWFTQELEPAFSTIQVLDQEGRRLDKGDARIDPRDATLLQVSLQPLAPGRYRVLWRVLAVDTHVSQGDFIFVVAP